MRACLSRVRQIDSLIRYEGVPRYFCLEVFQEVSRSVVLVAHKGRQCFRVLVLVG